MKRTLLMHVTIWFSLLSVECLAYFERWGSLLFWLFTFSNIIIGLTAFYLCWYFGKRISDKLKPGENWRVVRFAEFWYGILTICSFIGLRLFTDLVVFGSGDGVVILIYSVMLMRNSFSFAVSGFLFGMISNLKGLISRLNNERANLFNKVETLETKEIHLSGVIEGKEQAILNLNEQAEELQFNKEMLTRDIVQLEATVNRQNEQIATQNKIIAENNAKMEQMAGDTEMLQLNMFTLEKEISERQNLILVLKAELLKGNEEYKQLVYTYKRKFDFYNRELEKYRNLYGGIDDE